jgi:hypothetical protein
MSYSDRISKLRVKHLTNNKTYPSFIDIDSHKNTYEAIDPIIFYEIKDDCVKLNLTTGTRSSPIIYYNEIRDEFRIKDFVNIKHMPILETNRYFPGSPQYERQYPSA